jgi:alanine racemase
MHKTSQIYINKTAYMQNLMFIRELIGETCRFSSVIKGNAYGHGIDVFVPMALECGVDHFSVFSADEAFQTYQITGSRADIMIMGLIDKEDIEWAIEHEVSFFVFDDQRLQLARKFASLLGKPARIHIEVDTGMNRTGFDHGEFKRAVQYILKHRENFSIEGLCTHYAGAESIANYVRIQKQLRTYNQRSAFLLKHGIKPRYKHTACSAATISYPKTRMDLVRIGIMQYGFWPSRETLITWMSKSKNKKDPLLQLLTWKSHIMTTHLVKAGEFVGYGNSFLAESDMKIAIIPVGYAHGYSRSLSNQGRVLIGGQRVSVIGMVNMNMMIADVSFIPEVNIGDEVVLIGKQEDMGISVSSFSEFSDQLNYEMLTRLPQDIPRTMND